MNEQISADDTDNYRGGRAMSEQARDAVVNALSDEGFVLRRSRLDGERVPDLPADEREYHRHGNWGSFEERATGIQTMRLRRAAEVVLSVPAVAEALAAQERVEAALALADRWEEWSRHFGSARDLAARQDWEHVVKELRRALTGDAP